MARTCWWKGQSGLQVSGPEERLEGRARLIRKLYRLAHQVSLEPPASPHHYPIPPQAGRGRKRRAESEARPAKGRRAAASRPGPGRLLALAYCWSPTPTRRPRPPAPSPPTSRPGPGLDWGRAVRAGPGCMTNQLEGIPWPVLAVPVWN
jgi:hypothetical protein